MVFAKHRKRQNYVERIGENFQCTGLHVSIEAHIKHGNSWVVADVAIGRPCSGTDDVEYPLGNPPKAVCEMTSPAITRTISPR